MIGTTITQRKGLTNWSAMRANLTMDCISSTESNATGLMNQFRQSSINIWCSSTYVHLKTPRPKLLLEGVRGFKSLVACHCCLILRGSKKQSDAYLQYQSSVFSAFLSLMCACFISEEWISTRSYTFYHWQACVSLLYSTCPLFW